MATHADGSVDGSVARHKRWVIAAALPAVVALAVAVMLVTGAFPASGQEERSGDHRFHGLQAADGPQVTAEPLARSSFPDEISAKFRITPEGAEAAQVIRVKDPSEVLVAKITFDPGAEIGWHSHPGPAVAVVASGALTLVNADECVERVYEAGEAFMDAGQGHVHNGINASQTEEAVVYVTFLDVPPGGPPTLPLGDAEPVPCRS